MSTHGKIAVLCCVGVFGLTRAQVLMFAFMEQQGWNKVIGATVLSSVALLCAILVFVCFAFRIRSSKRSATEPIHWWRWVLISVIILAYASEPIATFYAFGRRLIQSGSQ